jgi:predicted Zn-dependent protease
MKDNLLKILLFLLDLIFLTLDSWIITSRRIKRIFKKEKDQPCHFCQGDDHSESPHPVRSVLKYRNGWLVKVISPCVRFKRKDGRRFALCKQEGGFTRPPAIVPLVAILMLCFWIGGLLGILYGFSSDREHFWGNFVTFFNPSSMDDGTNDEIDFLEGGQTQLNPERAERYFLDGIKALDQFKYAEAQVNFKRAIQSFPSEPNYHFQLAKALFGTGQTVDGEASLRRTLELDGDHVQALLLMAQLMEQKQNSSEALANAAKALELEPDNLVAVRMNAGLLAAKGETEPVRVLIDKLLKDDSENPATLSFVARIEFSVFKNIEASKNLLQLALNLNPDHVDSLMAMIPIYAQEQDLEKVNKTMDQVLKLQPDNLQALRLQAEMQLSRFGVNVGLRYYSDLMNRFGNNANLRLRYAELLLQSGNITEGKSIANQLTASRDLNIKRTAHWMLAQLYGQLRLHEEAIDHGQNTLRLVPDARNVQVFLAQQYLQSGQATQARRSLERALVNNADDPGLNILMAQILVRMNQQENAIALLDQKIQEFPDQDRLRMTKVELQMQSASWQDALSDTQVLFDKYPDNPALRNNLAFLLARTGSDLPKALELVESLKEQFDQNPVIMDTYGYVLAKMGQHEQAIPIYEQAISKASGNMTIRFHYATSLAAVGKNKEALAQLEAVLIISPDFPQADEARALQTKLLDGV